MEFCVHSADSVYERVTTVLLTMYPRRRINTTSSLLCPLSRSLAFASPSPVHAASSGSGKIGGNAASPPPGYPPFAPTPVSLMTPAERVVHVFVATTSNLINGFFIGSIFGFFSGAWGTRSFGGAFREAKTMGKSWAGISAIYAGLQTAAKVIRGKDDRYNALVGACGSGAAFQAHAGPASAAQGCVSFAALSYLIDSLTAPKQDDQSDEAILNKRR